MTCNSICDACDTVRHCSQHGCVPVQKAEGYQGIDPALLPGAIRPACLLRMSRTDLQPVLTQLLHDGGESGIQQAVALLLDYIDQGGGRL